MSADVSNVQVSSSAGTPDPGPIIARFIAAATAVTAEYGEHATAEAMWLGAGITANREALAEAAPDVADPAAKAVAQIVSDVANAAAQ